MSSDNRVASFGYTFTAAGDRDTVAQGGNDVHSADIDYDYDELHRVTDAAYANSLIFADGAESFDMDRLSNRTSYDDTRDGPTLAYAENNAANEYAAVSSSKYSASGNLREDGRYRYSYDFDNRLTMVELKKLGGGPGGGGAGPSGGSGPLGPIGGPSVPYVVLATFEYDALGRRVRETRYDFAGTIAADTLFYYDGERVFAEFDYDETAGTQTLARYYIDGPTYVDEHVLMYDATGDEDYYYLLQELYTVAGLADDDGVLVEAYSYDAYGDVQTYDMTGRYRRTATYSLDAALKHELHDHQPDRVQHVGRVAVRAVAGSAAPNILPANRGPCSRRRRRITRLPLERPFQLKLDFLVRRAALVFDVDCRGGWYRDSLARHLNSEALALLDAIGQAAQLGDELPCRIVLLDVALGLLPGYGHHRTSVAGRVRSAG